MQAAEQGSFFPDPKLSRQGAAFFDLNFRTERTIVTLGSGATMNTTETIPGIPDEVKAQLQQTLDDLMTGIRRPEKMKAACQRMDSMREENRRRFGEHNSAVDLIRESRDRA